MPEFSRAQVSKWLEDLRDGNLNLNEQNQALADSALVLLGMDEPMALPLPPGYLSPHFTLAEMTTTSTGLDNTPTAAETQNLTRTANTLEMIRHILGSNPIIVTSAFRSEAVNTKVGGVPNSAHRKGLAADFVCPAFGSATEICNELLNEMHNLGLDQLICEKTGGSEWVHIGLSAGVPRYQALTITDSGTQIGIV